MMLVTGSFTVYFKRLISWYKARKRKGTSSGSELLIVNAVGLVESLFVVSFQIIAGCMNRYMFSISLSIKQVEWNWALSFHCHEMSQFQTGANV